MLGVTARTDHSEVQQANLGFLSEEVALPASAPVLESCGPTDIPPSRPGPPLLPPPPQRAPSPPPPRADPLVFLLGSQMFEDISAAQFNSIAGLARFETLRAGELVFEEGRPGTEISLILQGRVELYVESVTPVMEVPLLRATAGEVVGEMALLGEQYRPYSAITLSPCELLVVDAVDLHALMIAEPELGLLLMRNTASVLSRRLRLMNLRLMNVLRSRHL